ncbi:pentapeptide repeat-containing protein [Streptomyces sp. NPDC001107]
MRNLEPRQIAELPYAHRLEHFTGKLEREGAYEFVRFDGCNFEEVSGGSSEFLQCAFSAVTLAKGRFRRSRFDDVWLSTARIVGADFAESTWMDSEVAASILAGVEMFGTQMRRVAFHNCKFDSVNARVARLRDVVFVDCLLRDVDLSGASLTNVSFPGSALDRVHLDKAEMKDVDLRDATQLGIVSGLDALKGARISTVQLLELAPALARMAGLIVEDHDSDTGR